MILLEVILILILLFYLCIDGFCLYINILLFKKNICDKNKYYFINDNYIWKTIYYISNIFIFIIVILIQFILVYHIIKIYEVLTSNQYDNIKKIYKTILIINFVCFIFYIIVHSIFFHQIKNTNNIECNNKIYFEYTNLEYLILLCETIFKCIYICSILIIIVIIYLLNNNKKNSSTQPYPIFVT